MKTIVTKKHSGQIIFNTETMNVGDTVWINRSIQGKITHISQKFLVLDAGHADISFAYDDMISIHKLS